METEEILDRLRFEWSGADGFLYGMRFGRFDPEHADRFLATLNAIDPNDPRSRQTEILGSIWFIPYYMLSHITNSERLGVDASESRQVMYRTIEIIGEIIGTSGQLFSER